jgi:hypothetical protein
LIDDRFRLIGRIFSSQLDLQRHNSTPSISLRVFVPQVVV